MPETWERLNLLLVVALVLILPMQEVRADGPFADMRATGDSPNTTQNEPSIAINPLDSNNAVIAAMDWRDNQPETNPNPWIYLYVTFDGGTTWSGQVRLPGGPLDRNHHVLGNFDGANDPSVAFDGNDNFFVGGLAATPGGAVFVSKYSVNRDPLRREVSHVKSLIIDQSTTNFLDKPFITADASKNPAWVFAAWWDATSKTVFFARSTDGAKTFGNRMALDQGGPLFGDGVVPAPIPATFGPGNKVYVAYFAGRREIKIASSMDGGQVFASSRKALDILLRPDPFLFGITPEIPYVLSLVTNPVSGNLYLAWDDYRYNATRGNDILFSSSADDGLTWRLPQVVNDDISSTDQFYPSLAAAGRVSGDQEVNVIFYDRRFGAPTNPSVTVFYVRSSNGGVSWSSNVQIADVLFSASTIVQNCVGNGTCNLFGHYVGLSGVTLSDDTVVMRASWTDSRISQFGDIFTDHLSYTIARGGGGGGCGCHQTGPGG